MTGDDYDRRLTENIGQPFSYRFIKEDYEDYSIYREMIRIVKSKEQAWGTWAE